MRSQVLLAAAVPLLVLTGILLASALRAHREAEAARLEGDAIELAAPLATAVQLVGPSRELAAYQVVSVQGDGDLGAVFSGSLPAFDALAGDWREQSAEALAAASRALDDHGHLLADEAAVRSAVAELARVDADIAAGHIDDLGDARRRYDDVRDVLVGAVGELLGGTGSTDAAPVLALVDAGDALGVEATVVFLGLMGAEVDDGLLDTWRRSVVTQELRLADLARTAPGALAASGSPPADPAAVARAGYGGWEPYRSRFARLAGAGPVEPSVTTLASAGAAITELADAYETAQATLLGDLLADVDRREADAESDLRLALILAASAVLVTGAVTLLVTRSLSRPLTALAARARRLGEGELGGADTVEVAGRDEVATLAATFEEMERNLVLIGAQTEALAAGEVDAAVLAVDAPGRMGSLLRRSVATLSDTTRRLRDSEALSRTIVDSAPDAIVVADLEGTIISANASAQELARHPAGLVGARLHDALGIEVPEPGTRHRFEHVRSGPDGWSVPLLVSVSCIATATGGIVTVIARDIRDRKALEARLAHDATHDQLTGLLNRAGFSAATEQRVSVPGSHHALLFVDLDRFKRVNDTQGHAAGDAVLREVARRIRALVRGDDVVGRIGGDEFVVLADGLSCANAQGLADRLVDTLREPYLLPTDELAYLGASVGMACTGPDRPRDADRLLAEADLAMYAAKRSGASGRVRAYDDSLRRAVAVDVRQEQALRRALTTGELPVHFQPIVRLRDERIVGAEALLRWADRDDELANPARLVQVAESSGLIHDLGAHVLDQALRAVVAWRRFEPDLTVAVNISARQLSTGSIVPAVRRALAVTGADGPSLHLEVTETQLLEDTESAARQLDELRSLGVGISLDDFGTGFSSLNHLSTLPIDTVKIDRAFTAMVVEPGRRGPSDLAELVVAIGAILGLDVVAEGVETRAQAVRLRELGCELAQGFLWSPAVPEAQVTSWLAELAGVAPGAAPA